MLPKGQILFQEGEPCHGAYYVEEGELELTITSGEKRLKLGSAQAGHLLGVSSVVSNSDHQCSAHAVRDSKVAFVGAEQMRILLQQNAEICLLAVQKLGAELLDLSEKAIRPLRLQPRYPKQG
jgi:CRP-like cAMP-binding protein